MKVFVRPANNYDKPWLRQQLSTFKEMPSSHCAVFVDKLVDKYICFVAESEKSGLVGVIAGILTPHIYNPEKRLLAEMFFWVEEEYKKSAGAMLLEEFLEIGDNQSAQVQISMEKHCPLDEKFLLKSGFKLRESIYVLGV